MANDVNSKGLGLDVSLSNIGYALVLGSRVLLSGNIKSPNKEPVDVRIEYLRRFFDYIITLPDFDGLQWVVMERTFVQGSGDTTRILCEVQGVIKNQLFQRYPNIERYYPPPSTWRHIFIGSGKVDRKKTEIKQALILRGIKFETEHEAEAIAMALSYGDQLKRVLSTK